MTTRAVATSDATRRATEDDTSPAWLRVATTLVVLTVTYAAFAHGAYYASELRVVLVLLGVAFVAAAIAVPLRRTDLGAPVVAAVCLALWYVAAGFLAHHPGGALPAIELLAALAALVTIVRRADDREREFILFGLLVVGAVVALAGWSGVAWHRSPRAIADDGLWRAASTITYANATGAMTGALALVACARLADGVHARLHMLLAFVLLTGAFATASRGALLGVATGAIVLAVLYRERMLAAVPAVVGALVAMTWLLPSMPSSHDARPLLALLGLTAGAIVSLLPLRATLMLAVAVAFVVLAVPAARHGASDAWQPIKDGRFTTSSSDRSHELHAALKLAGDHPVAGVGPGNVDLRWTVTYFVRFGFHVHYAHDEYVQVMVESGLIGLLILALGFIAVGHELWSTRARTDAATRAGTVAALTALGVQSGTDFLWHVPVVPIVAAVLVGLWLPRPAAVAPIAP